MQIEAGKFYRSRDGRRFGPMAPNEWDTSFPWVVEGLTGSWTSNGAYYVAGLPSTFDLVAEWTDEPPAVSPTLAQDGETHVKGTETAADAETPSTDAGNEKDGDPAFEPCTSDDGGWSVDDWDEEQAQAELKRLRDYAALWKILVEAHQQSSQGKGRVRHANGRPWLEQPIMTIGRDVGLGYPTGQALKKIQEAVGMVSRGEREAAVAEILGAIVYAAAAVQLIREGE